jgi:hypothetical protein
MTDDKSLPDCTALAAAFRAEHPFCLCCAQIGIQTATEVVDHVIPIRDRPDLALDPNNLQALCDWCALVIKRAVELQWRLGLLSESALRLDSPAAVEMKRKRHVPRTGLDGYPIPGT